MYRQRQKATNSSSLCQIYGRNNVSNDSIIFIYLKTTLNAKQMFEALLMLSYNCHHSKTDVTLIGLFVTYAKWLLSINGTENTVNWQLYLVWRFQTKIHLRPVSQNNKKQQYVLLKLEKLFDSHKYVATYQNRVSLNEITVQYQVLLYWHVKNYLASVWLMYTNNYLS